MSELPGILPGQLVVLSGIAPGSDAFLVLGLFY